MCRWPWPNDARWQAKLAQDAELDASAKKQLADDRAAAVKTLTPAIVPSQQALGRFRREAAILARLDHPHVVKFLEFKATGGLLFFVMEFVPGKNAALIVKRDGPLAPDRARRWIGQAIDGLTHAHDRGFVHRDVKPFNLLVVASPDGNEDEVKVSDFGLARAYENVHV